MHSYNDWYAKGYHVKRGEHSKKRDARGVPLFSKDQVERNFIPRPYPTNYNQYEDYPDDEYAADHLGVDSWGS